MGVDVRAESMQGKTCIQNGKLKVVLRDAAREELKSLVKAYVDELESEARWAAEGFGYDNSQATATEISNAMWRTATMIAEFREAIRDAMRRGA